MLDLAQPAGRQGDASKAPRCAGTPSGASRLVVDLGEEAAAGQQLVIVVRTAATRARWSTGTSATPGWEELDRRRDRGRSATRVTDLVPVQRPPDDKASYRISIDDRRRLHRGVQRPLVERRRDGSSETWVFEQAEPMATYLATVQIGRYATARARRRRSPVPLRVVRRPASSADVRRRRSAGRPRCSSVFTRAVRPLPVRRLHRGRDRRRPRDPAGVPDPVDVRAQLRARRLGARRG